MSADQVVHGHHPVLRHLEAHGPVAGLGEQPCHLVGRQGEGVAQALAGLVVVDEGLALAFGLGAPCVQLLGGVEGVVGPARLNQLLGVLAVDAAPLALAIWCVRMALARRFYHLAVLIHSLVGDDAAPVQGFDNVLFRSRHEAMGVGILDTDDEVTSVLLGIKVIVKCGAHPSHMKRSGRGWRKSYSCLSHFCILLIAGVSSSSPSLLSSVVRSTGGFSGSYLNLDLFAAVLNPICEVVSSGISIDLPPDLSKT